MSDYDEGYRAGLQKSRDVAGPYVNKLQEANTKLEIRIEATMNLLRRIHQLHWEDNPALANDLHSCMVLLDPELDDVEEQEDNPSPPAAPETV